MNNYIDKVRGAWLGKSLGGAVGMAYEGVPYQLNLTESDIFVQEVPNDDLELQLVWLTAMKKHGVGLDYRAMAEIWLQYIPHGCDEYSMALRNLKRGILPPASGWKDNFFVDGMGAAIRSEIWAAVFAGRPDAAGHFAALDAVVDHWGDGVYAEVYLATAECLAFADADIHGVLKKALSAIPAKSRLGIALHDIIAMYEADTALEKARTLILQRYKHYNFTDCVMNLATVVFCLLWGKGDFIKSILLAVNMGQDTDCTAATVGAFIGIANGAESIPAHWREKVSDKLVVSPFISMLPDVPTTITGLVEQTFMLHQDLSPAPSLYPAYTPYQPTGLEPSFDRSSWLIIDENECDIAALEQELLILGDCPERFRNRLVTMNDQTMDLSTYAANGNHLHLFSFINVEAELNPDDIYLSATADTGSVLYIDGVKKCENFSRNLMIPSFHRAEGGNCFHFPLYRGERRLVHWWLYSCTKPLRCTLMFGNSHHDHLEGIRLEVTPKQKTRGKNLYHNAYHIVK